MQERSICLGPREQQIAELLLQGCDNDEIARQLKMARRTVKAHFNRLFLRFGITDGVKRVKLATLLYRRQLCLEANAMEAVSPMSASNGSSNSLRKGSKTATLQLPSVPPNTSSRTIFASSTTSSGSGIESSSRSGTKPDATSITLETTTAWERWERTLFGLEG